MSGDWLHMCTYMVHWIPPFPGKWEIFCDNMIGSHLFRFMGAAHGIIIAIYQEARWWIIARFGFLTYSWFVRATRIMICVCDFAANQSTWSCGSSALWSPLICLALSGRLPLPTPLRHLVWDSGCSASKKRFYSATLAFTVVLVNSRVEL